MKPRVALVGYGRIAPKHLDALRAAGADIVACCNRSEAGRKRAETEGRIPQTFGDIDTLVKQTRPDAIVCTVSFFEVHAVARQLMPYGVPLLLEKPTGTTLAEHEELIALAKQHGTPVMVGVNRRHYSVIRDAIDDAGGRAAITHVDIDWSEDAAHFLTRGFTPAQVGKMIFGNSVHGLDLITFLAGGVSSPQIVTRKGTAAFDWTMALQGIGEAGATVSFRSTWASPGRWRLQFCSPRRRYSFAPLETCLVQQTGVKEERTIAPRPDDVTCKPGFLRQARALLDMISSRRAPVDCDLDAVHPTMDLAQRLSTALND